LPDVNARTEIFKIHIGSTPNNLSDSDYKRLGSEAEGLMAYSTFIILDTL